MCMNFAEDFTELCFYPSDSECSMIGSEKGLVTGQKWLSKQMMVMLLMHIYVTPPQWLNTLRPRQNGRHFPDDIFKWIFLNENVWISITISLNFVPRDPINNIPTLVQVMALCRPGDTPLSETMMVRLRTHICVTRPQWDNENETTINPYNDEASAYRSDLALTHWGRVTHLCVGKLTTNGSDNGLSPGRRQVIIWTNTGILLIGPLGTNFIEHLIGILTFSFTIMHLKMSSAKWRPFVSASMS